MLTSFAFKKNLETFTPASFKFDGDGQFYAAGQKSSYYSTSDISQIPASMHYSTLSGGEMKLSYSAWIKPQWFSQNYPIEFFSIEVPSATGIYTGGNLVFCYDSSNSTLQVRFNAHDGGVVSLYNLFEAPISVGGYDYNSSITGLSDTWTITNTPLEWTQIGFIFDINAAQGATASYEVGTQEYHYDVPNARVSNMVKMFWNGQSLLTFEFGYQSLPSNYLDFYSIFTGGSLTSDPTYITLGGKNFPGAHYQDQVAIRLGTNVLGNSMMTNYYNSPLLSMNNWVQNGVWHYPAKGGETNATPANGTIPSLTPYSNGNLVLPVANTNFYKA